ncbi:hypothetical protein Tco_1068532 [Tanacetum coccineum]|uniref:Uncharacterized protein n=1 Tax=Tanacetum coccineum TaxID=301880 RepID=A0ABQ5HGH8_9ASTR
MSTLKFAKAHNMVAFLEKPTESEGFEQIIDFLNASTIKFALTINLTVYVSSVDQFWTTAQVKKANGVAKIHALIDVKCIVVSEVAIRNLLQFNDEGGIDCLLQSTVETKSSQQLKIENLERKVKKLEKSKKKRTHKLKRLYKVGLSARVMSSDDEEPSLDFQEDKFKQERSIADIDDDADITLVDEGEGRNKEMCNAELDLAGEEVIVEEVNVEKVAEKEAKEVTIMEPSDTQRTEIPKQKNLDKGKGKMDEIEKPMKLSRKEKISFDEEEATRLQALFDEEAMMAEEAAKKEAQLVEKWDNVKAMMDVNYELASKLQAEEQEQMTIKEKSKLFVELMKKRKKHFAAKRVEEIRSKPPTKAQKRKLISTYLKNMDGWKLHQLKNKSYDEVKKLFDQAMVRINNFLDMDSEVLEGEDEQQSTEKEKELSKEKLQKLLVIVPVEEVYVEALKVKYLIINWEVYSEESREYWKIIRDWVKKRFSTTEPTNDKEKELWVELKRLFEPDDDDILWKLQRYMHDPLVWKLYDTCGVHHVSSSRGHDIFMLVEKDYPLTRALMTVMLANKLQVDGSSEMANKLLRNIFYQVNSSQGS